VLGSVPTMVLFILLVVAYSLLVRRPLEKTLAERRARTSGAVEQAREAISAAEAETASYEAKLRAARAEIVAAREARIKKWNEERDAALASARTKSLEKVNNARKDIEASAADARAQIQNATEALSEQILKAVLPAGTNVAGFGEGARQ